VCSQENILISDDVLKLADFGSCRGIYSKQPYTEYISTRWYRAPECLLTDGYYNYKMDIWGVGCVFFEIVSLFPLFPGTNELDQINKIHSVLGTPTQELFERFRKHSAHIDFNFPSSEGTGIVKLIPHAPPDAVELMLQILAYNPDDRLSARQALRHAYFRELRRSDAEQKQKAKAQETAAHSTDRGEKQTRSDMRDEGESQQTAASSSKLVCAAFYTSATNHARTARHMSS
jgi:renal tumor antigen